MVTSGFQSNLGASGSTDGVQPTKFAVKVGEKDERPSAHGVPEGSSDRRHLTGNTCNARTAADWLGDGCEFSNPSATTVFDLGSHNRVTPTTSCEVTCPTDGGDFVVTSATGVWVWVDGSERASTQHHHHRLPPFAP